MTHLPVKYGRIVKLDLRPPLIYVTTKSGHVLSYDQDTCQLREMASPH